MVSQRIFYLPRAAADTDTVRGKIRVDFCVFAVLRRPVLPLMQGVLAPPKLKRLWSKSLVKVKRNKMKMPGANVVEEVRISTLLPSLHPLN